MFWYYTGIYCRVCFTSTAVYFRVLSHLGPIVLGLAGVKCLARTDTQVSRVVHIWTTLHPPPPCRIGSSASVHKRSSKRPRALSECQLGGRFSFLTRWYARPRFHLQFIPVHFRQGSNDAPSLLSHRSPAVRRNNGEEGGKSRLALLRSGSDVMGPWASAVKPTFPMQP